MTLAQLPLNRNTGTAVPTAWNVARILPPDGGGGSRGRHPQRRRRFGVVIVAVLNAVKLGIDLARTDPQLVVDAFVGDWASVDRLRESVFAERLADRVRVRIIDALPLVDLRDYDLVLVDAEHRDWLLQMHVGARTACHR